MIEVNRRGANRLVILTRRHAFKLPNVLGGWFQACWGMIDNMQERRANGYAARILWEGDPDRVGRRRPLLERAAPTGSRAM